MARKTDGISTPRKKKTATTAQPAPSTESAVTEVQNSEIRPESRNNVTPINVAPVKSAAKKPQSQGLDTANLDEEIRRRAYELFLERNGAAGDPNADWLVAEREVRARYAGKDSALAASQGRS